MAQYHATSHRHTYASIRLHFLFIKSEIGVCARRKFGLLSVLIHEFHQMPSFISFCIKYLMRICRRKCEPKWIYTPRAPCPMPHVCVMFFCIILLAWGMFSRIPHVPVLAFIAFISVHLCSSFIRMFRANEKWIVGKERNKVPHSVCYRGASAGAARWTFESIGVRVCVVCAQSDSVITF